MSGETLKRVAPYPRQIEKLAREGGDREAIARDARSERLERASLFHAAASCSGAARLSRKSTAFWPSAAARKIARLSSRKALSQLST